ncbi:pantetheine-phosphate adenylyltransferase [Candidatus Desantisbacteria bacterium]|nr:pantetheine-phosphate adenylyltransferase [Candidatus Desantisbacteria bacterium]
MKKTAVYPGTFDPVTNGHIDIIKRGIKIFNKIIVAVMFHPKKSTLFSLEERIFMLEHSLKGLKNIKIEPFDELLVDFVKKKNAQVVIRGVRAISDFDYEFQMALMNRQLANDIETIFMIPNGIYSYLSSSLVKEIAQYGGNIDTLVPMFIKNQLQRKFKL